VKRRLSESEARLWKQVAQTVVPLRGHAAPRADEAPAQKATVQPALAKPALAQPASGAKARALPITSPPPPTATHKPRPLARHTLDSTWDRRIARGELQPDFTLDLHGATLDAAHIRLEHGLSQALAQGARVLLLITGRPRPQDELSPRGERRGAIRAKFMDWLAAGPFASRIAAVRPAHTRHGGAGAVYLVLRRPR
jgi:DNA-nicking Smr family endonuclease